MLIALATELAWLCNVATMQELNYNGLSDRLFLFIQYWNKVVVDVSTRD